MCYMSAVTVLFLLSIHLIWAALIRLHLGTQHSSLETFINLLLFTEVSVSHNSSEIILICWFVVQETFIIIINVKNSFAAYLFCGNNDTTICIRF